MSYIGSLLVDAAGGKGTLQNYLIMVHRVVMNQQWNIMPGIASRTFGELKYCCKVQCQYAEVLMLYPCPYSSRAK